MAVRLNRLSRLRFGNLLVVDEVEFWDTLFPPSIPIQSDDITYWVQSADRMDLLADTYYGSPQLWWVIAVANDMDILPTDLKAGESIRIPSPRFVSRELFSRAKVRF